MKVRLPMPPVGLELWNVRLPTARPLPFRPWNLGKKAMSQGDDEF
jgi:hypothetical protein